MQGPSHGILPHFHIFAFEITKPALKRMYRKLLSELMCTNIKIFFLSFYISSLIFTFRLLSSTIVGRINFRRKNHFFCMLPGNAYLANDMFADGLNTEHILNKQTLEITQAHFSQ
jgi:hypothetical protein